MAKPKQSAGSPPLAPPVVVAGPVLEPLPTSLRYAVWLMYAGAVLSAIDLIVSLATAGSLYTVLEKANPHTSHVQVANAAHAEITASVLLWVVTIIFWIVMARTNQAGRSWARIIAAILCALATLSFFEAVREPAALISKLIYLPLWLVGVVTLVLLWRKDTTAYIKAGQT